MKDALKALSARPELLFLIGYMLFPVVALVFAALGLWMILTGQRVGGLVVLLLVTQVFVLGAFWAISQRRKALDAEREGRERGVDS
ncbi:NF038396 family protein [Zafaria sp. Z1313]|uniref:NF038396 family protein n=1 Tax=unclassified Zafaria TaxID=2828765 RepID=UPI002E76B9EC|nr:NF038396 family protein [Zafaria sp. J156]MEE1620607.1 NF038396 family protein [Zafaria sp. J156]